MNHFLTDRNGVRHEIEEWGWEEGKVCLCLDKWKVMNLKLYYREPRTWDEYMGNKPCGYYAVVPITKKERRRVYLHLYS